MPTWSGDAALAVIAVRNMTDLQSPRPSVVNRRNKYGKAKDPQVAHGAGLRPSDRRARRPHRRLGRLHRAR